MDRNQTTLIQVPHSLAITSDPVLKLPTLHGQCYRIKADASNYATGRLHSSQLQEGPMAPGHVLIKIIHGKRSKTTKFMTKNYSQSRGSFTQAWRHYLIGKHTNHSRSGPIIKICNTFQEPQKLNCRQARGGAGPANYNFVLHQQSSAVHMASLISCRGPPASRQGGV